MKFADNPVYAFFVRLDFVRNEENLLGYFGSMIFSFLGIT